MADGVEANMSRSQYLHYENVCSILIVGPSNQNDMANLQIFSISSDGTTDPSLTWVVEAAKNVDNFHLTQILHSFE